MCRVQRGARAAAEGSGKSTDSMQKYEDSFNTVCPYGNVFIAHKSAPARQAHATKGKGDQVTELC